MAVTHSSSSDDRSTLRWTRSSDVGVPFTRDRARPRNARDRGVVPQDRHELPADVDAATLGQFAVRATRPVGAEAVGVDLSDESGEPLAPAHRG